MGTLTRRTSVVFVWLLCGCCTAPAVTRNLALRKPYTLQPNPNYSLCTDDGDAVQLTDGIKRGSDWTKKSTVGWQWPKSVTEIEIDLGQTCTIDEVRVHTVGGGWANIEFPEYVAVLVSDDQREFRFGGLAGPGELSSIRHLRYPGAPGNMTIPKMEAVGRYVRVVVWPRPPYFFADEVEVFGEVLGNADSVIGRQTVERFQSTNELLATAQDYLQLRDNIAGTINAVQRTSSRLSLESREKTSSDLHALLQRVALPAGRIHSRSERAGISRELGRIRARIYQEVYERPYVCVRANPMEIVFAREMCFDPLLDRIQIRLWANEYEPYAFNIINCSETPMTVSVSISPVSGSGGTGIESQDVFTVRRALFVSGAGIGSIADALVLQKDKPFAIEPGALAQIWLTVHNPAMAPGRYKASLAVLAGAGDDVLPMEVFPVEIDVADRRLPSVVALNTCVWAYPEAAPETRGALKEVMDDLKQHYTNVFVSHSNRVPFPTRRSVGGASILRADYTELDRLMEASAYARTYLFFFNFNKRKLDYGRFGKWMTPEWKGAFRRWLLDWVEHLKGRGIGYDQFAMYPFDEVLGDEFYAVARLIKDTDPRIRIYANSFGDGPRDFMRFRELIDIWCPHARECRAHPDWLETIRGFGKDVWTYAGESRGPAKSRSPYAYYRLLPWQALSRGQSGAGFWSYVDYDKRQGWDDLDRPAGYWGVIYGSHIQTKVDTAGEAIVPSRRWEAWREGVEDYQYLYELQQAIKKAEATKPAVAKQAQETLDRQVRMVLSDPNDSDRVYRAREVITGTLVELTR